MRVKASGITNAMLAGSIANNKLANSSITINGSAISLGGNIDLSETICDTVGAMFSSNSESGITVTYQDSDNTIDLTVGTLNQNTTGNAATATLAITTTITENNSTDETVYPVFVDGATGAQGLESDTGLTYNPSSGVLTSTNFTGALTGNVSGSSGSCTGNAATATKLAATKTINGVAFDGSANITVTAAGTTLSDTVPVSKGGTGATSATAAATALGLGTGNNPQFNSIQ